MGQDQGGGEDIRPAEEIREDLIEVDAKIEDVLVEGQRKLDVAERIDNRLDEPVYGEERVRLRGDVIEPLNGVLGQADQVIQDLDSGRITPAQAQNELESLTQVVADAESTVDDVGDFKEDEDDEDEDDEYEDDDDDDDK
ncbi:hypothetical protein OHC51_00505 [Stenotrophomonas indicatrix]|uniref:hypothetical protein n=1 Tax=Stenotrophomonas indicatrix TaxID=2045451 RepID=UPI00300A168E